MCTALGSNFLLTMRHGPCVSLQKNELPLPLKTWIGKEIAVGLAYLASVPIVHRYIKGINPKE